jgi:hypothetical protein
VLDARPHQRLRWHYFMLWQMIGVEIWRDTFTASQWTPTPTGRPSGRAAVAEGA